MDTAGFLKSDDQKTELDELGNQPAYREGVRDAVRGLTKQQNPYKAGTDAYMAWWRGWMHVYKPQGK